MSFPPIPPLSLNVSNMEISNLKIDEIDFQNLHFELPLHPLYILCIGLFILSLFQTFFMLFIVCKINKYNRSDKALLNSGFM